jgi:hypothetical protein
MPDNNKIGTIFIREDTPLPKMSSIETEAFLPGWRVVKNLDRQALTREVERANWNFFYLAGDMRATVFGRDGLRALRRAVKAVLGRQEGRKFNSLEITKVVSKRFFGIPFITITAHSRHIQEGIALVPAKGLVLSVPALPGVVGSERQPAGQATVKQHMALISSV